MPRKKSTVAASEPTPEPTPEPTCSQCSSTLTWRDLFYGTPEREGDDGERIGSTCKRCHQRNDRSRLVLAFHPAIRVAGKGKDGKPVQVPVTRNRAARRGQLPLSMRPALFDPSIAPRTRKPTRAERRVAARKKAVTAAVQAA